MLSKIIVRDPKKRMSLEMIRKDPWYNQSFESAGAPKKYTSVTVTEEQLANAVSHATMTVETAESDDAGGAPTYVCDLSTDGVLLTVLLIFYSRQIECTRLGQLSWGSCSGQSVQAMEVRLCMRLF